MGNKTKEFSAEVKKKIKQAKSEFLLINAAIIVLGIIMVSIPNKVNDLICQSMGVLLCVWGVIRIISYFRTRAEIAFSSFGMAQGCALLGFGIFFLVNPRFFSGLIDTVLAIGLLIAAMVKLQYAFDYQKLGMSNWWVQLIGSVIMAALGIMALTKPYGIGSFVIVFIGISLIFSGIWDIVTMLRISGAVKSTVRKEKEKDHFVDTVGEEKDPE